MPMALTNGSSETTVDTLALPASQCRTVADLERTLTHLSQQDAIITSRLNDLLSMQEDLNRSLSRLDLLRAHLGTQVVATRSLSNDLLSGTASTATRVTTAVRNLDIEQSRVKATLHVVEQVAELKACVLGVTGSMGAPQDWETAAAYLHRASKIPLEIINGEFAEMMVPTAEVPDSPPITLENARESLCGLFLREFEKAVGKGVEGGMVDGEKVTRFFKLFPLIDRGEVGLDVYGKYVCGGISSRARQVLGSRPASGGAFFYPNALTRLFEHIAGIVEQHSPLVERHYGRGKMGRVIMRVQTEADTQGGIILDAWGEEREVDRKLTETKSYAFTFLVQSFLPGRNPQRTGSPATPGVGQQQMDNDGVDIKEIDMILLEIGAMLSRWSLYCRFMARKFQEIDESGESTDSNPAPVQKPLTIPPVITDSTLSTKIQTRLIQPFQTLTTFFLRRSVEKAFQLEEPPNQNDIPALPLPLFTLQNTNNFTKPPPQLLGVSGNQFISSVVDDVMFIVDKVLQRTLETAQVDLAVQVIGMVGRVLGGEFVGMIGRRMRDESYLRVAAGGHPPNIGGGGGGPGGGGGGGGGPNITLTSPIPFDTPLIQYLVLLNNLEMSATYLQKIISGYTTPPLAAATATTAATTSDQTSGSQPTTDSSTPANPSNHETLDHLFPLSPSHPTLLRTHLSTLLTTVTTKSQETLTLGIQYLFDRVLKPRLRILITEAWRDVDYSAPASSTSTLSFPTSDTTNTPLGGQGIVKDRFQRLLYPLLYPFKFLLLDTGYTRLLHLSAKFLSRLLEKKIIFIATTGGNNTTSSSTSTSSASTTAREGGKPGGIGELEAILLERDVAGVVSTVVALGRYDVRDVFARCLQICLVLGMEEEEVLAGGLLEDGGAGEDGGGLDLGGVGWKLSVEERRKVRGMIRRS